MSYDILVTTLVGAVLSAVGALFLAYRQSQAAQVSELSSQRDAYKAIADRSVTRLEQEANDRRVLNGMPPLPILSAVVPNHASPVTAKQQEAADYATLQARAVAATLDLDYGAPPSAEPLEYDLGVGPMVGPSPVAGPAPVPVPRPRRGRPRPSAPATPPLQAIETAAAKVAEAAEQIDAAAEAQRAQDAAAEAQQAQDAAPPKEA